MRLSFTHIVLSLAIAAGSFSCSGEDPIDVNSYFQGKNLLFCGDREGKFQIFRWTPDSLKLVTTDLEYHHWLPEPHPDGNKFICFKGPIMNGFNTSELWRYNLDGSKAERLISLQENNWLSMHHAKYSPDGRWIILNVEMLDEETGENRWKIFVCDSLGKNPRNVSEDGRMYYEPSFNPGGGFEIVYAAWPQGETQPFTYNARWSLEVHTGKIDTSNWTIVDETRLTDDDYWNAGPAMTSNGQRIAYTEVEDQLYPNQSANLFSVWNNGEELAELLRDGRANYYPRWTSDDQQLLFHRLEYERYGIYTVSSTGGGLVRVVPDEDNNYLYPVMVP